MFDEESFAAWRENPVTQFVLTACRKIADENKAAWVEASWVSGNADPDNLLELRTRADAYMALSQMTLSDLQVTHGETE